MISEMETIQILSSRLREEELENERLRREKDAESEKAFRAVEDARVARESAEQYRVQLEEERRAQGDRIESMLKEVMMFITGKGTASLSESLSDSIIRKMQEQHARELAEQKAADEERFRKMDEEHRIREAALESRIRELEDIRNNNDGHDQGAPGEDSQKHFHTLEEAEAAYLNEKRKNDDLNRLRFAQSTEGKYAGRTVVDADAADMKGEDAPDSTYDKVTPETVKEQASLIARYQEMDKKMGKYADWRRNQKGKPKPRRHQPLLDGARDEYVRPEGWDKPESVFVKEEIVPKITYVPGYARGYNLHIQTYIVDGVEVTPDVFNKKCLATEEMVGMVLYMHYVEHVTVAQIYKELRKMGVNISEATLDSWIAIGIDEFKPLMEPTQKEIVASGEAYMDETHLLVKCDVEEEARHRNELISEGKATGKPVPLRDDSPVGDGDTLKNRMHYLGKWLHNIISPKAKLSNFLYRDGDRGAYIAAEYLIGAIDFFLHCDGAKMYKSFEKDGKYEDMGIIRVACGSHVRRPFWKLKLTEEEARWVTEKMDSIFVKEDSYKGLPDEERKRRRGTEVTPILHEIKQRLDILKGEKSAPDAWKHPGLYEAVDYALREWKGIQNYLLTGSGDFTNNICEREMRTVGTLRNNSLFWGSHTSAERLSVILTIVRSALMNSLNVYQYIVYCLKTIRSYKGDLADLLANKWKPSDTELMPILA